MKQRINIQKMWCKWEKSEKLKDEFFINFFVIGVFFFFICRCTRPRIQVNRPQKKVRKKIKKKKLKKLKKKKKYANSVTVYWNNSASEKNKKKMKDEIFINFFVKGVFFDGA